MTSTIVTLAEARDELAVDSTNTASDTQLSERVTAVNAFIGTRCDREFDSATYTHVFNGSGTNQQLMNEWPVTSITSVTFAADWDYSGATAEDSGDYRIDSFNLRKIWHKTGFIQGIQNTQVVYVGGYTTMPEDLVHLGRRIVAQLWSDRRSQSHGLTNRSEPGGASFNINRLLSTFDREVLAKYTRWGV